MCCFRSTWMTNISRKRSDLDSCGQWCGGKTQVSSWGVWRWCVWVKTWWLGGVSFSRCLTEIRSCRVSEFHLPLPQDLAIVAWSVMVLASSVCLYLPQFGLSLPRILNSCLPSFWFTLSDISLFLKAKVWYLCCAVSTALNAQLLSLLWYFYYKHKEVIWLMHRMK